MDTMKITDEAPEIYAQNRKRREIRTARIRKYSNCILVFSMAALLLFWCYTCVSYRMEARTMLGQAKSVELAIRLTAIKYYGYGSTPYDADRESGLKKDAEKEIIKYADVDGQLRVLGWDEEINGPTAFIYRKGKMLVFYKTGEDGQSNWQVYRMRDILSVE